MSKYAGMREDLVQAGGGNSAYKIANDKMAIKASGYQLADITEKTGYAIVNPKIIRDAFLNCADLEVMTEEESFSLSIIYSNDFRAKSVQSTVDIFITTVNLTDILYPACALCSHCRYQHSDSGTYVGRDHVGCP